MILEALLIAVAAWAYGATPKTAAPAPDEDQDEEPFAAQVSEALDAFADDVGDACQQVKAQFLATRDQLARRLFQDERAEQQLLLADSAAALPSISADEGQATNFVIATATSLVINAAAWLAFPPLAILSLPLMLYVTVPTVKAGVDSLRRERKVNAAVSDAILLPGVLILGYWTTFSVVTTLISISHVLILRTEDRSRQGLLDVFGLQTKFVWRLKDGIEVETALSQVQTGDVIVVHAGEVIPVDGVIAVGQATVDQRAMTGEEQPVEKAVGDQVFSATFLTGGRIQVRVEQAGEQTIAVGIQKALTHTVDFRKTLQSHSMVLADASAPWTLGLSVVALPLLGGESALAVVASSVGHDMRVTAPLSMLNFLRVMSERAILVKDARSLDLLQVVDTVIFDKTGTLTLDQPKVQKIHVAGALSEEQILRYAAAAEGRQTHPIGRAILQAAIEHNIGALPAIDEAQYEVGYGLQVRLGKSWVSVGSQRFMDAEQTTIPASILKCQEAAQAIGHSLVMVAVNGTLIGALELEPTIRPDTKAVIDALHELGLKVVILSGDQEAPTSHMAEQLGVDRYFAGMLPQDKAQVIKDLQAEGHSVCFVGDGINDAIALKQANVSISLRNASTIATDTAQIVLMDANLQHLPQVFNIAHDYGRNMRTNYVLSLVPGVICIGGIFFFGVGLLSGAIIGRVGQFIGIGNAMRPLLRYGVKTAAAPPTPGSDKPAADQVAERLPG